MDLRANINLQPNPNPGPWFIALTLPGQDAKACDALRNRRYQVYRPIMPKLVPDRHRRLSTKWMSMFPGYLFVIDLFSQGWEALRTAPAMRFGEHALYRKPDGNFATMKNDHPDFLRIREIEQALSTEKLEFKPESQFKVGQMVKINDGSAFTGQWKEIQSLDDEGRVCLLLSLFGRTWPAHFEPQHLISA